MAASKEAIENCSADYRQAFSRVRAIPQQFQSVGNTVYWLEGNPLTLYTIDAAKENSMPRKVFDAQERKDKLSREEILLRERLRSTVGGVSQYILRDEGRHIFFESNGTWYVYATDVAGGVVVPIFGEETPKIEGVKTDVEFAPNDWHMLSFVVEGNVFIAKLDERIGSDGATYDIVASIDRVTSVGTELKAFGTSDYIMQEEFSRYKGTFWAPDGSAILMTHTNNTMLNKVMIIEDGNSTYPMPFPKVGDPNAVLSVVAYDLADRSFRVFSDLKDGKLVSHKIEYVTRLGWVGKDAKKVFVTLLNREQEEQSVVASNWRSWPVVTEEAINNFEIPTETPNENETVNYQKIPWAWVDTNDAFDFGDKVPYMAYHDADGYFHIHQSVSGAWEPVTSGKWNVESSNVRFVGGDFYFLANKDDKLGRVLYRCLKDGSGWHTTPVSPLTAHVHGFHLIQDNGVVKAALTVSSTLEEAPFVQRVSVTDPSAASTRIPFAVPNEHLMVPGAVNKMKVVDTVNSRGVTVSAAITLPKNATPGSKVPLAVYVYGGPHVQLVYRSNFNVQCNAQFNTIADQGIAVAVLDGQMSNCNSLKEHAVCKKAMGSFEIDDYVCLVKYLTEKVYPDILDSSRVSIFGWSYGGYASLLAMCQAPDVFKMGFSGAPVGDWRLYDTGYTERYMGVLPQDEDAYERSTIKAFADGFPDDLNRVYIAHGLSDENVHFAHSSYIISAMIEKGKPHNLQVYPGERHGLRQNPASAKHYDSTMIRTMLFNFNML